MILLNFSHPVSAEILAELARIAGGQLELVDIPTHLDLSSPIGPQVAALADSVGLSRSDWQGKDIVVELPSHASIAGVLLAELHGRMGHFPTLLRRRPQDGPLGSHFVFAEAVNLDLVRTRARQQRQE